MEDEIMAAAAATGNTHWRMHFDSFTEMRWVTVQRGRRPFPF